jgi:hypothetical protein
MKRSPLRAAAILTLLMTSALVASQNYAQDSILMPEIVVTSEREARQHPQDGNYSERPLGCVEVVTPRGTGNELGGHFQARFARAGIPVMPSLRDPSSANETRPDQTGKNYQPIPPGTTSSTPPCR